MDKPHIPRRPHAGGVAAPLSDQDRAQRAEATGGQPLLTSKTRRNAYLDYEHIDTLLNLQTPRSDSRAEMCFYIIGQAKELLFKLLYTEFSSARQELAVGDAVSALWTLRRAAPVQRVLTSCWEVLARISPTEFLEFRDHLGPASGLQSYMYRRLEFLLGNKNPAMMGPHLGVPSIAGALLADLKARSLYDEAIDLLSRRGANIPPTHLNRDKAMPYEPHEAVEAAWAWVYRDSHDIELVELAEALSDVAYQFSQWRSIHLLLVEKTIGNKPGTGSSSGLPWLRSAAEHRFFPELWAARGLL